MEPKTKQYLLITVVGVTLFVALLRLSSVLAFAAQLVDLVLPILAGGILALFINVPMTGLEKRLKRLFCKAKKQPSDKVLHLLSFFITRGKHKPCLAIAPQKWFTMPSERVAKVVASHSAQYTIDCREYNSYLLNMDIVCRQI